MLVNEPALFLDKSVVKPYLAVVYQELDHVPMDSGPVPVIALIVTLTGREMDRTEYLLIKENIPHRPADGRIDSDGKLAYITGAGIGVENPVE